MVRGGHILLLQGWYNLGRPKLPYVEYQSKNGGPWAVVPLEERLIGRKTNLLTGPRSGGEPSFLSLQDKKGPDSYTQVAP